MKVWDFPDISSFPKIVWQIVEQLIYTMFIINNHASFHMWWKEYLVKHHNIKSRNIMTMIVAMLGWATIWRHQLYSDGKSEPLTNSGRSLLEIVNQKH